MLKKSQINLCIKNIRKFLEFVLILPLAAMHIDKRDIKCSIEAISHDSACVARVKCSILVLDWNLFFEVFIRYDLYLDFLECCMTVCAHASFS